MRRRRLRCRTELTLFLLMKLACLKRNDVRYASSSCLTSYSFMYNFYVLRDTFWSVIRSIM